MSKFEVLWDQYYCKHCETALELVLLLQPDSAAVTIAATTYLKKFLYKVLIWEFSFPLLLSFTFCTYL